MLYFALGLVSVVLFALGRYNRAVEARIDALRHERSAAIDILRSGTADPSSNQHATLCYLANSLVQSFKSLQQREASISSGLDDAWQESAARGAEITKLLESISTQADRAGIDAESPELQLDILGYRAAGYGRVYRAVNGVDPE